MYIKERKVINLIQGRCGRMTQTLHLHRLYLSEDILLQLCKEEAGYRPIGVFQKEVLGHTKVMYYGDLRMR